MTIKRRVLAAIRDHEPAEDAISLVTHVGTGPHEITHILWRLQKEGLITFRTRHKGHTRAHPTKIKLTPAGHATLDTR